MDSRKQIQMILLGLQVKLDTSIKLTSSEWAEIAFVLSEAAAIADDEVAGADEITEVNLTVPR